MSMIETRLHNSGIYSLVDLRKVSYRDLPKVAKPLKISPEQLKDCIDVSDTFEFLITCIEREQQTKKV